MNDWTGQVVQDWDQSNPMEDVNGERWRDSASKRQAKLGHPHKWLNRWLPPHPLGQQILAYNKQSNRLSLTLFSTMWSHLDNTVLPTDLWILQIYALKNLFDLLVCSPVFYLISSFSHFLQRLLQTFFLSSQCHYPNFSPSFVGVPYPRTSGMVLTNFLSH